MGTKWITEQKLTRIAKETVLRLVMHIYSEEIELQKSITLEFRRKVKNQVENPALGEKPGKSLKINSRIFLEII